MLERDSEFRRLVRAYLSNGNEGWVYFIVVDDEGSRRVKIGFSRNVQQRLKHIEVHSAGTVTLLRKLKGTREDEREWHRKFSHLHLRREWFRCTDDLIAAVRMARDSG